MTKVLKSKVLLGAACLVLAAVVAFLLLPRLYASKSDTVNVLKLAKDVPAGTVLTADMLSSAEVGAYGLPDSILKAKADAVGMVAAERLYAGEFLTESRLVEEEAYTPTQTRVLEAGQYLVTIQLPGTSSGLGGVLRSGDTVDVQEWIKTEEDGIAVETVLPSMYIYDVLNTNLESLTDLDRQKEEAEKAEESKSFDFKPTFIVFRCTEAQAQTLIRLEQEKTLHLTLKKAGD